MLFNFSSAILFLAVSSGFPGDSNGKESACNAGGPDSTPGLGRSPGEGNGNPLQYFCLKNPMDRTAWQATVHRVVKELDTTQRLNNKNNNIPLSICTTSSCFCCFHVNFLHCLDSTIKVVNTQNFKSVVFGVYVQEVGPSAARGSSSGRSHALARIVDQTRLGL